MKPDKSSEGRMTVAAEMKDAIVLLAGPRGWHENRKSWLAKAARIAGISPRQSKALFYGEGNPRADVVERVRAARDRRYGETLKEARHAYNELVQSIQRAESALRVSDADFHCNEIDALREILGDANRAMGRRVKP